MRSLDAPLSRANADSLSVWYCRACRVGVSINAVVGNLDNVARLDRRPPLDWPAVLAKMKRDIPLQMRIPKSARNLVADALTSSIESALVQNSCQAWWDLLIFPYHYLRRPFCRADKDMTHAAFIRMLLTSNPFSVEGHFNGSSSRTVLP